MQAELDRVHAEQRAAQGALENTKAQADGTRGELDQLRAELDRRRAEVEQRGVALRTSARPSSASFAVSSIVSAESSSRCAASPRPRAGRAMSTPARWTT